MRFRKIDAGHNYGVSKSAVETIAIFDLLDPEYMSTNFGVLPPLWHDRRMLQLRMWHWLIDRMVTFHQGY